MIKSIFPGGGGGGKRTARVIVGTSTAGWTAEDCDYLCDGVADDVEINAAIKALPSIGGEIVILDGTYSISSAISTPQSDTGVVISGSEHGTVFKPASGDSGIIIIVNSLSKYVTIKDIRIDGNGAVTTGILVWGSYCKVIGCIIQNCEIGIRAQSNVSKSMLLQNQISGCTTAGIQTGAWYSTVSGNIVENCGIGIYCEINSDNSCVISNVMRECNIGIKMESSDHSVLCGNAIHLSEEKGIYLYRSEHLLVVCNSISRFYNNKHTYSSTQYSIHAYDTEYNLISLNSIPGKDYVTQDTATGNVIINNQTKCRA